MERSGLTSDSFDLIWFDLIYLIKKISRLKVVRDLRCDAKAGRKSSLAGRRFETFKATSEGKFWIFACELSHHHSHHSSSLSNGSPFKYIKFKREKVSDSNLSLISCFITPDFWIVIILIRLFLLEGILEEKSVFATVFCVY